MPSQATVTPPGARSILLGLTGGIAAYKAAELCRTLVKSGHDVQVAMSEAATRFITPVTMQALSGKPVATDLWDPSVPNAMGHIELGKLFSRCWHKCGLGTSLVSISSFTMPMESCWLGLRRNICGESMDSTHDQTTARMGGEASFRLLGRVNESQILKAFNQRIPALLGDRDHP